MANKNIKGYIRKLWHHKGTWFCYCWPQWSGHWMLNCSAYELKLTTDGKLNSPLSSMEFMESSLGLKWVPIRSDMEWAAESLCVPGRRGLLTFVSGWGCGLGTQLDSESQMTDWGRMAEDVSPSCFRTLILSLSLEKGERGFSFMERSNMLAVMLFLINCMLTSIRPRSFFFFPGLDSKEYQLQRDVVFLDKQSELEYFLSSICVITLFNVIYKVTRWQVHLITNNVTNRKTPLTF